MSESTPPRVTRRKVIRWIITVLVISVVGYFFARALWDNWDQVADQHLAFNWLWVLATVIFAVAVPVTGLLWGAIVRWLAPDARISAVEAIVVQCASWLLKYIPGQVGSVVNKVAWAGKKGISRTLVVISFLYENVFLQIASFVPSVAILVVSLGPAIFGENVTTLVVPLLILIPLFLVLYKPAFHWMVNTAARRVLKQEVPEAYFLSGGRALWSLVLFVIPRVLNGLGFVLIAGTIADVAPGEWLPLAAAYVLAGAIGILAFFVPSGLGVREGVIVLILSQYMPVTEAIVISLVARLCSTLGDAIVALIYVGLRRTIPKETRP